MRLDEDSLDFDTWFEREGYDEQHMSMFATVWDAALDAGKNELDDEWHWLLDNLKST